MRPVKTPANPRSKLLFRHEGRRSLHRKRQTVNVSLAKVHAGNHQLVWIVVRERAEKDSICNAEDRGAGTDPQAQLSERRSACRQGAWQEYAQRWRHLSMSRATFHVRVEPEKYATVNQRVNERDCSQLSYFQIFECSAMVANPLGDEFLLGRPKTSKVIPKLPASRHIEECESV